MPQIVLKNCVSLCVIESDKNSMYTSIIKIANRAGDSVRHLSIYSAVFAITLLPEVLLAEESKVVSTVNPMGTEQLVRMTLGLLFILALIFFCRLVGASIWRF